MENEHLLTELRDGVLYLTLNQPAKLNAMSQQMMEGLLAALRRAAADSQVGAVVLTGAGRGFCSGGDITAMRARESGGAPTPLEEGIARLRENEETSLLLHEIPKVTIAAINGPATGAGLSLALACDLRIASDAARFGTAFAKVGFSGDFGGTWTMTKVLGSMKARELYFLADLIDAQEALKIGLVAKVFPAASLMEEVGKLAHRIASGPRIAYRYMKANLNKALTDDFRTLLDREAEGQTLTGRTEDHREAVKAFLEKRPATFKGR
jgi:2-(1,2-epoxy-1,2-dihydrophenyl)acetyl-CoA isomerase